MDRLLPGEQVYRTKLLEADGEIQRMHQRAEEFGRLVRERRGCDLKARLTRTAASGMIELSVFVGGLRRDQAAVEAALTVEWSNGQTEGQINRLKFLKRQMYGRASSSLLRKRVLRAA
jgi:transposase